MVLELREGKGEEGAILTVEQPRQACLPKERLHLVRGSVMLSLEAHRRCLRLLHLRPHLLRLLRQNGNLLELRQHQAFRRMTRDNHRLLQA